MYEQKKRDQREAAKRPKLRTAYQQKPQQTAMAQVLRNAEMRERNAIPAARKRAQTAWDSMDSLDSGDEQEGEFLVGSRHVRIRHKQVSLRSSWHNSRPGTLMDSPLSGIITTYRELIKFARMSKQTDKRQSLERQLASLVGAAEPTLAKFSGVEKQDTEDLLHDTERIMRLERMKSESAKVDQRIRQLQIGEARDALTKSLHMETDIEKKAAAPPHLSACQSKFIREGLDPALCTSLRLRL
jgi:hypothetical protein